MPFRRQRMDIDNLAPLSKEAKTLNNENYCCSIAQIWEKANVKGIPKVFLSFVINKNLILCYTMKMFSYNQQFNQI